jgi:hypothetical protein
MCMKCDQWRNHVQEYRDNLLDNSFHAWNTLVYKEFKTYLWFYLDAHSLSKPVFAFWKWNKLGCVLEVLLKKFPRLLRNINIRYSIQTDRHWFLPSTKLTQSTSPTSNFP